MNNTISIDDLISYLKIYIPKYREEFQKILPLNNFTMEASPYLSSKEINCYIVKDGIFIGDTTNVKDDVAILDVKPNFKPDPEDLKILKKLDKKNKLVLQNITVKNFRYWIQKLSNNQMDYPPFDLNKLYELPDSVNKQEIFINDIKFNFYSYNIEKDELLRCLTLGALSKTCVDLKLYSESSEIGSCHLIRTIKFKNKAIKQESYFNYLQIFPYSDKAAWDNRSISLKISQDVSRDILSIFKQKDLKGSIIEFHPGFKDNYSELKEVISKYPLLEFEKIINEFEKLINIKDANENVFQKFIEENPIIIDLYALKTYNQPQLLYPDDFKSKSGKMFVIPDFILEYYDHNYVVVEIERPNKKLITKNRQATSLVTQAISQINEFFDYIERFPHLVQDKFPEITSRKTQGMLVIGRNSVPNEIKNTHRNVQLFYSYDELLERAKQAYNNISSVKSSVLN